MLFLISGFSFSSLWPQRSIGNRMPNPSQLKVSRRIRAQFTGISPSLIDLVEAGNLLGDEIFSPRRKSSLSAASGFDLRGQKSRECLKFLGEHFTLPQILVIGLRTTLGGRN